MFLSEETTSWFANDTDRLRDFGCALREETYKVLAATKARYSAAIRDEDVVLDNSYSVLAQTLKIFSLIRSLRRAAAFLSGFPAQIFCVDTLRRREGVCG